MLFTSNIETAMNHLHKKGAFLTVKNQGKINTMTISWGNIGYEWNKPIFTILVRKSRFTHEILEKEKEFSVSIPFNDNFKEALALCGSKSGRNTDKIEDSGLILKEGVAISVPSIEGCGIVYECKIVYKQDMDKALIAKEINEKMYADNDYHTFYYGEIINIISAS